MSSASYPFLGGGGGVPTYASLAGFPSAVGAGNGALAVALDTNILYESNGAAWIVLSDPVVIANAITQLHGDVAATGPGNAAATLATVNSNVGSFGTASNVGTVTVNGKGLITAASNTAILITESQVTNLTTDLAAKVPNTRAVNTTSPLTGGGALSSDLTLAVTSGNLTDAGTDGITVTGGTGAVLGSGTSIAQHVADASHNGYLSSTDWSTFNSKQSALTLGNLTDAGTDGITVTGGSGAVVGSGTSLAQHVADTTHNGYLSSTDWNTFNGKQAAGNYITALTGDVTAAGPGSSAATLATVNGNVGTFGDATHVGQFTVNGKGLITAASNVVITAPMSGNVRASEGGGTVTLTSADSQTQTFNLSSAETVKLPTTGIAQGDIWVMINPTPFTLTIQSSGANTILTNWGCKTILQANVATPTAAADWTILESVIIYGRIWTPYTPTFGGFGTVASSAFFWMRVGSNMLISGKVVIGTASGAATASATLPTPGAGVNIDTNVKTVGNACGFGIYHILNAGGGATALFFSNFSGECIYSSGFGTNGFRFESNSASAIYTQQVATAAGFSNGDTVDIPLLTIPIAEWAEV